MTQGSGEVRSERRIGVLGGTFDPVHYGHLILGEQARDQLNLDAVLFVPANVPWRKADRKVTPPGPRLELLRIGIADNPAFAISEVEIARGGPSYTADTLEAIAAEYPRADLFFLLGEDALQDLPNWRDPARITAAAALAVAERPGARRRDHPPSLAERVVRVTMPAIGITATDIRERLSTGRSIRYLTPGPVIDAIHRLGLYA